MSLYLFRIHYLLYYFLLKIILKIWMEFKLFKKINHLRFFLWVTIHLIFYFCFLIVTRAPTLCWGFCSIFLHWVIKLTQKHIIAFS